MNLPYAESVFLYKKNKLYVENVSIESLLEQFGSPLYVYSGNAIRDSYHAMMRAFKGQPLEICYAVKANSNLHILKLLNSLGAGCDLVSYGEWYRAEKAGFPRKKRVLSGVAKTLGELQSLLGLKDSGVYSFHVESQMEFELISVLANSLRRKVNVAFRYNPDVDAKTHDKISTGRNKDKFGLTREEILDLSINYAEDEFVNIAGLSIHIGSQIVSLKPYESAFKKLSSLAHEVELHLDRSLEYLDLGGGIGICYQSEKPISLNEYAKLVRRYFKGRKKLIIEPGRSLLAHSGALVSQVVYSKVREKNRTLILDAGMNDLVRPALYDAYHSIVPLTKDSKIKKQKWDVVGGICESSDYFAKNRDLQVEGFPGEAVAILSSGAYGFSMSSTYNTRPRVAEVLVDQGKVKLIRKRETLFDLVRHEL